MMGTGWPGWRYLPPPDICHTPETSELPKSCVVRNETAMIGLFQNHKSLHIGFCNPMKFSCQTPLPPDKYVTGIRLHIKQRKGFFGWPIYDMYWLSGCRVSVTASPTPLKAGEIFSYDIVLEKSIFNYFTIGWLILLAALTWCCWSCCCCIHGEMQHLRSQGKYEEASDVVEASIELLQRDEKK